jgi:hypothetical protein
MSVKITYLGMSIDNRVYLLETETEKAIVEQFPVLLFSSLIEGEDVSITMTDRAGVRLACLCGCMNDRVGDAAEKMLDMKKEMGWAYSKIKNSDHWPDPDGEINKLINRMNGK